MGANVAQGNYLYSTATAVAALSARVVFKPLKLRFQCWKCCNVYRFMWDTIYYNLYLKYFLENVGIYILEKNNVNNVSILNIFNSSNIYYHNANIYCTVVLS